MDRDTSASGIHASTSIDIDRITSDIERVKGLVSLSSTGQEGFSHQIYRHSLRADVSQPQILRELDALKKRLYRAAHTDDKTQASDDVDAERANSDDVSTVPLTETDRLRQELLRVRAQQETWTEDIERRLDVALEEKDSACDETSAVRNRLDDMRVERDALAKRTSEKIRDLENSLQSSRAKILELEQLCQKTQGSLDQRVVALAEMQRQLDADREAAKSALAEHKRESAATEQTRADDMARTKAVFDKELQDAQLHLKSEQDRAQKLTLEARDSSNASKQRLADLAGSLASTKNDLKQAQAQSAQNDRAQADCERKHEQERKRLGTEFETLQTQSDKLQSENEQLLASCTELQHKLDALQTEMSSVKEDKRQVESTLQARSDELARVKARLQEEASSLVSTKQAHNKHMQKVVEGHTEAMARLIREHERAVQSVQAEASKKSCEMIAANGDKMQALQQSHDAAIEKLKNEHDSHLVARQKVHDEYVADREVEHATKMSELSNKHDLALASMQQETTKTKKISNELLTKIREEHSKDIAREREQHRLAISASEERNNKGTKAIKDGHISAMGALEKELEKHMNALNQMKSGHQDELTAQKHSAQEAIAVQQERYADVIRKQEALLEQLAKAQKDLVSARGEYSESHRQLEGTHQKSIETLRNEARKELNNTKHEHETRLTEVKVAHDQELSSVRTDLQELSDNVEQARVSALTEHKETLLAAEAKAAEMLTTFESEKAEMQTVFHTRLAQSKQEDDEQRGTLLERISDLQKQADDAMKEEHEEKKALEYTVSQNLEDHKAELDKLVSEHEKKRAATHEQHEGDMTELRAEMQTAQKSAGEQHAMQLRGLQIEQDKQLADSAKHLAETSASYEASMSQHKAEIAELQHVDDEARAELDRTKKDAASLRDQLVRAERNREAQAEQLRQENDQSLKASEELHNQKLADTIRAKDHKFTEAFNAQTQRLTESEKKAQETMNGLQAKHKLDLDDLHSKLAAETATIQSRLDETLRAHETLAHDSEDLIKKIQTLQDSSKAATIKHQERVADLSAQLRDATNLRTESEVRISTLESSRHEAEVALAKQISAHERETSDLRDQIPVREMTQGSVASTHDSAQATPRISHGGGFDEALSPKRDMLEVKLGHSERARRDSTITVLQLMAERDDLVKSNEALTQALDDLKRQSTTSASSVDFKEPGRLTSGVPRLRKMSREARIENVLLANRSSRSTSAGSQGQEALRFGPPITERDHVKSFEEYLSQAQTELSELGQAISTTEKAFAEKIQQHVGDLQAAKETLADEYKQKFEALVLQRQELDSRVASRHVDELEAARSGLRARFAEATGGDAEALSLRADAEAASRTDSIQAFQYADRELVAEHHTKLVKRRSRIMINHATDFESLSIEFDKRVAGLRKDKESLDVDLSIEPADFEQMTGDAGFAGLTQEPKQEVQADHMRSSKISGSTSRSPKGNQASRAGRVVLPHERPTHAQSRRISHPPSLRTPQYLHAPSHSHSVSQDGVLPRRTIITPRTSNMWSTHDDAKRNRDQDLSIEPSSFELSEAAFHRKQQEGGRAGVLSVPVSIYSPLASMMTTSTDHTAASVRTAEPIHMRQAQRVNIKDRQESKGQ